MSHCVKCDEFEPSLHDIHKDGLWGCSCHKLKYKPVNGEKLLDKVIRELDEANFKRKH